VSLIERGVLLAEVFAKGGSAVHVFARVDIAV
jgi:hypothetical protein